MARQQRQHRHEWQIGGVGKFNALSFFVLDAADVGGKFSIKVGDTLYSDLAGAGGRLKNGNIHFVRILLDEAVENLTVELMHDRSNDGFGIDGVTVAQVAPVPLPPAAALLLPGLRRSPACAGAAPPPEPARPVPTHAAGLARGSPRPAPAREGGAGGAWLRVRGRLPVCHFSQLNQRLD